MTPLVIFDCDGVLVDSEAIASEVLAEHLAAAGFPYTVQQCRDRFTGLSLASCQQLLQAETGRPLPTDFLVRLQRETFARFAGQLQPVDGVRAVLDCLCDWGWTCCVASSGSHDKMAVTLGITGLQDYFAGRIFSAHDVMRGKPAPDLFLHAAAQMGFEPRHCIVVEDSLPGIRAGLAAGMAVCAFSNHPTVETIVCETVDAQTFAGMSELPAILLSMQTRCVRAPE